MLLKIGSSGADVKRVQEKLGIKVDGYFGKDTELAVKKWQDERSLVADGIVGQNTWRRMFPEVPAIMASVAGLKTVKLSGHVPDAVIGQIAGCATQFLINSPLRLSHFLAQCGHESLGFSLRQENLNYSAIGLQKIFPKYFPGDIAERYARQPEKIASRVYANRMGNGDEASKEGFLYRGRGYIQLTGKNNYRAFGLAVGDDLLSQPDKVASQYSLLSAAWFWQTNGLNTIADKGASEGVVTEITRKVNGGTNGLPDRIARFKSFYDLLA